MKITLSEWLELDKLRKEAMAAVEALSTKAGLLGIDYGKRSLTAESALLASMMTAADDAKFGLSRFDCQPQSEWMGGPTEGRGSENTKTYLREPHAAGTLGRRYFTAGEVTDARAVGLLTAGLDVTGPTQ